MNLLDCWLSLTILFQLITSSLAAPPFPFVTRLRRGQIISAIRLGNVQEMEEIALEFPELIETFEVNFWMMALKSLTADVNERRFRIFEILWVGLVDKYESKEGLTPLLCAVYFGNERAVELVLRKSDLDAVDEEGNTALIQAIRMGSIGIAQTLIENGAEVNINNIDNDTALHFACRLKNSRKRELAIKLLLDNWAEVSSLYKPFKLKFSRCDIKKISDPNILHQNFNMDELMLLRLIMDKKMMDELWALRLALKMIPATLIFVSVSACTVSVMNFFVATNLI